MAEGFWSQFEDTEEGRFDAPNFLANNAFGFLPIPVIITEPAVEGGLGFFGIGDVELTWQIDSRWSVLGFTGSGRAANSLDELKDSASRVTMGAGFRYLIAKRYGFEMGMDIARGPAEDVIYIQGGTAWR